VHALLDHLDRAGLEGIPKVLGMDRAGREVLTFLPGRSVDVDTDTVGEALLVAAVRWLRRFHDAVGDFRPAGVVRWRNRTARLGDGEIVCHHDPGVYNWIVAGDRLAGMLDWDMAGPGQPIDDLAFMAWTAVPLFRPIPAPDVARRLLLMAGAYGGPDAAELLDHAEARMRAATDRIEAGQRRGDAGMLRLATVGEPARTRQSIAGLRERRPAIEAALRRTP
jgi:aminoglycoside phosphotransferase (APT) family kinase protein